MEDRALMLTELLGYYGGNSGYYVLFKKSGCVRGFFYDSHNKQRLFPWTALIGLSFEWTRRVFIL
jgi:hypothetical protein